MFARRDQFKSSYGAFTAQQRELERDRARHDARDAAEAAAASADDEPAGDTAVMPAVPRPDGPAAGGPSAVARADKTTVRPDGAEGLPAEGAPGS